MMGEAALKLGPLADLELLDELLTDAADLLEQLKGSLEESRGDAQARLARNAELRNRLENMKKQNNGAFTKILTSTFKKFDRDGSNELEMGEFHKAWKLLGLKGSADEVDRAFHSVDANHSGRIDCDEFVEAIKTNRASELSTTLIMEQMEGQLEGLDSIFAEYRMKQEESRKKFQKTMLRRRMMKKKFDAQLKDQTKVLRAALEDLLDEKDPNANPEEAEFFDKLRDTFNAFDGDGSGQLQFPEYCEAWKFLNQPGGDEAAKKAFDSVDVDHNEVVDQEEFVFSIMGEQAMKYGVLADMEKVNELMSKE